MFKTILKMLFVFPFLWLPLVSVTAQDMSTYYTVTHPEDFDIDWTSFYKKNNEATRQVRKEFPHHLDLAFGKDPKQALDLYIPNGNVNLAPVFLFLHGGGFREGDRAHYGSIARPFLKHGIITAVASYRLTGDGHHYPAQSNDVKAAIKWLYENVSNYGGRPDALFVGGHSAGAILSADVAVNREWMAKAGLPKNILRGIIPVSGPYDMRKKGRPGEQSAYAPTAELQAQASPILHITDPVPSALVVVGSKEKYRASSSAFAKKLKEAGSDVYYLLMEGEDHDDTALSLANEKSELFQRSLDMIQGSN